jgi:hypothetical protein
VAVRRADEVGRRAVEGGVGALAADEVEVVRTRERGDVRSEELADLDGDAADPAAGAFRVR